MNIIRQSLTLVLPLVAAAAMAQTWTDNADSSFAGGSGTESDPYLISTAEQLAKLSADTYGDAAVLDAEANYRTYVAFEGVYFRLTDDIDLDGYFWQGIGGWKERMTADGSVNDEYKFMGVFDGDGHSVSNMYGLYGLFGSTGLFAEVRGVTVTNGEVTANGTSTFAGGIVGNNRGLVEDCVNHASVSSLFFYPGGIVGNNGRGEDGSLSGTVRRCVNYGTVSSQPGSANGMGSGGIAGSNSSVIDQCANYGSVSAVVGAGGLVAYFDAGRLTNSYNRGPVTASSEQAAGVVTNVLGRIGSCRIVANYNTGAVNAPSGEASLSLLLYGMPDDPTQVVEDYLVVSNVYNDANACPGLKLYEESFLATIDEATVADMATADMKTQDFADVLNAAGGTDQWVYDSSTNEGYPTFRWFIERGLSNVQTTVADGLTAVRAYGLDGHVVVEGIDAAEVAVYDMSGAAVARGSIESVGAMTFDRGIYVVTVTAGGQSVSAKVAL